MGMDTVGRSLAALAVLAAALTSMMTPAAAQTRVRLAVGGQTALFYLPLNVTDRLGYFRDEGLDVQISDLQGGSRALQALLGGSADVVAGAYDHTIQIQPKGQRIVAVVQLGRYPGYVAVAVSPRGLAYRSPRDLAGMTVGVTAPGSSTQFMAQHLLARAGLKPADASFVGVGTGATAVAAAKRGDIDVIINVDPAISAIERDGKARILADTRTLQGTQEVFGGTYPAAVLYTTPGFVDGNAPTVQKLVNALVRGLKWIANNSPAEIAKILPAETALGDATLLVRSIEKNKAAYSPDGRFSDESAATALQVLRAFDPAVRSATIDLKSTHTERFVDNVKLPN